MRRRLSTPPVAPQKRTPHAKWTGACSGRYPAEALTPQDREDLIRELHALGWTDVDIASHTKLSTYTTARIRDRIGLAPNAEEVGHDCRANSTAHASPK